MIDTLSDARSLTLMRATLVTLGIVDACTLLIGTLLMAPEHPRWIAAAGWSGVLASTPWAMAALAAVAIGALARFAQQRSSPWPGLVALVALRLEHEAVAASMGVHDETYYHVGAFLLGWVGGLGAAQLTGATSSSAASALWRDRLAARCATAMLAATWMNAGISKLRADWLEGAGGDIIRLMALRHVAPGHAEWRSAIVEGMAGSPVAADALAAATVVVELGAIALLASPRLRAVAAALVFSFHLGTFFSAGIFFFQAAFLALAVGIPWVALFDRARGVQPPGALVPAVPDDAKLRRLGPLIASCLAVVVLAAVTLPPRAHPVDALVTDTAPPPSERVSAPISQAPPSDGDREHIADRFGPISLGDEIDGFRVEAIRLEPARALVILDDGTAPMVFEVSRSGGAEPSPVEAVQVSYWPTSRSIDDVLRARDALVGALSEGGATITPGQLERWLLGAP